MNDSADLTWTDQNTGETFVIDSQTGNSHPQTKTLPWINRGASFKNEGIPIWLQDALKVRWLSVLLTVKLDMAQENQVYAPTERRVTVLKTNLSSQLPSSNNPLLSGDVKASRKSDPLDQLQQCCADADTLPTVVSHRFQKEDLQNARVIDQIDKKFIACLIETSRSTKGDIRVSQLDVEVSDLGPTLVLIDQHAADERIRVERFLEKLCLEFLRVHDDDQDPSRGATVRKLSPSVPVLLTLHEAQRLAGSGEIRQAFRYWGFLFEELSSEDLTSQVRGDAGYIQVMVQAIPELVADKVRAYDLPWYLNELDTTISVVAWR
jgi:DNA mismatch repair protein MLH3